MIEYISGKIVELTPANAVIDCGGIGYDINISLMDYTALQGKRDALLYIYEAIREDAHDLYGFTTKRQRVLFLLLIGVSGVGPNTARLILSSLTVSDLEQAIASGNDSMLKAVKGIGGKTAQRIIVDLKDKIKPDEGTLLSQLPQRSETFDEALSALLMLGFTRPQSEKVLRKVFSQDCNVSVESAVKQALKLL